MLLKKKVEVYVHRKNLSLFLSSRISQGTHCANHKYSYNVIVTYLSVLKGVIYEQKVSFSSYDDRGVIAGVVKVGLNDPRGS